MPRMLDLFCGINGASMAFRKSKNWDVVGIDIEPVWMINEIIREPFRCPEILADIRTLNPENFIPVDFLWASPPCTYYSRKAKVCWYPNEPEPSHELYELTKKWISIINPKFWVIENVVGAQKFWGKAPVHYGSIYLWTNIPKLISVPSFPVGKYQMSGTKSYLRSEIPIEISELFKKVVERNLV